MKYPSCHFKCNGILNCQQLDHLLLELDQQNGREETISFYRGMLRRNFKNCPLNHSLLQNKSVSSMY
jgi:hypothetical protein